MEILQDADNILVRRFDPNLQVNIPVPTKMIQFLFGTRTDDAQLLHNGITRIIETMQVNCEDEEFFFFPIFQFNNVDTK